VRERLTDRGVVTIEALRELPHRSVVEVAGTVTHRQRPSTAKGIVFVNLEDETGMLNVICTTDVWGRFRKVARMSPALIVRGMLERYQGVINVLASRIEELPLTAADLVRSRDFR
jgi:error-prone DNA polymerase